MRLWTVIKPGEEYAEAFLKREEARNRWKELKEQGVQAITSRYAVDAPSQDEVLASYVLQVQREIRNKEKGAAKAPAIGPQPVQEAVVATDGPPIVDPTVKLYRPSDEILEQVLATANTTPTEFMGVNVFRRSMVQGWLVQSPWDLKPELFTRVGPAVEAIRTRVEQALMHRYNLRRARTGMAQHG